MSNDLDAMLNQAPTLTFEPFPSSAPEAPAVSEPEVAKALEEEGWKVELISPPR